MLSALVAVPLVFWLPAVLTPGRSMSAPPLNDTPPIFLAVCNKLAVAELPVQLPDEPDTLPVTLPVILAVTLLIPTIASAYTVPHFCAT